MIDVDPYLGPTATEVNEHLALIDHIESESGSPFHGYCCDPRDMGRRVLGQLDRMAMEIKDLRASLNKRRTRSRIIAIHMRVRYHRLRWDSIAHQKLSPPSFPTSRALLVHRLLGSLSNQLMIIKLIRGFAMTEIRIWIDGRTLVRE